MACRSLSLILLALSCLLPCGALAAQEAQDETGLKAGTKVENFSLQDQNGKSREFDEMLKSGPVAIVFYRSADW